MWEVGLVEGRGSKLGFMVWGGTSVTLLTLPRAQVLEILQIAESNSDAVRENLQAPLPPREDPRPHFWGMCA